MNKSLQILFVCCLFFNSFIYAQNFPDINFSLLSTANGLPTNLVTTVFKDSRGIIWMGTENDGLLRYDGKKIKCYHNAVFENGIASNYVGKVCEDKQGWLWISTLDGLYHLNPITESIEVYRNNTADNASLSTNEKPRPFVDSKGKVWVTGLNGLQQFDTVAKKFIKYSTPPVSNIAWQTHAKAVNVMMEDSQHRLWAGSAYGIYLIDTLSHSLKPFFTGSYTGVTSIYQDEKQQIWVSFWGGGLKKFNPATGKYTNVINNAHSIQYLGEWIDGNNKKWLYYFDEEAFTLYDPGTNQLKKYQPDAHKKSSLKGNYSTEIYKDDEGRLWLCTDAGINIIDKKLQQFSNHFLYADIYKNNSKMMGDPKALLVQPNEYILSTWYWGNVYRYDKQWKLKVIADKIPPASKSRYSNVIYTIQRDDEGNIWYGTDSGLVKQTGNTYKCYLPADTFNISENQYAARNIVKRSDGLFWCRFANRGLYIFDEQKGKFYKNYRNQYEGIATTMENDPNGKLWLGTDKGLYYYKPSLDSFIKFPIKPPRKTSAEFYNKIYQVVFDKNNVGWIATYYGLLQLTPAQEKVEFITDPAKPKNYIAYRILQDSTGTMWILTGTGITAYNKKTKTFIYYSTEDGLPELFQGFPGVFNWLNDSTIAVGSIGVITSFNPYQIVSLKKATKILFTDVYEDGTRIPVVTAQKKITVSAGTKIINVHFAFLNYSAPQQNRLYYRVMSAKANAWIESDNGDITLLGLHPGSYVLQVKGECNGNMLNGSSDEIIIEVQPFWYQTLSFKVIFLAILILLIYLFITWRIKLVKAAAELKQRITETEIAALKAQMNPHFIFNCISSIDGLIQDNDKYSATVYLNKFAKLIRNVLDSSKENTIEFSKDIETLQLYIDLEKLRDEDKYKTELKVNEELLESDYQVPPLVIQPFVENAIHHGLRNKNGENGVLMIEVQRIDDQICYTITDNGVGREATMGLNNHTHQSYGVDMSTERIRMFNKEPVPSVTIEDLYTGGQASGTCVTVKLHIK